MDQLTETTLPDRNGTGPSASRCGAPCPAPDLQHLVDELRVRNAELEGLVSELGGAFEHAPVATAIVRLDAAAFGRIVTSNRALLEFIGPTVVPRALGCMVHPADRDAVIGRLLHLTSQPAIPLDIECRLVDEAGPRHARLVATNTFQITGPDGPQLAAVVQFQDVTSHRAALDRVDYVAEHDQLTGLVNRATLQERLAAGLARMQVAASRVGLVLIDLDHFKVVNEALGHAAGDLVLLDVAARLESVVREGDTVARLGGDEFAVLCIGLPVEAERARLELDRIAQRMLDAISSLPPTGSGAWRVTASAGTRLADLADTAPVVFADADAAMYSAKHAGRRQVVGHDPSLRAAVEARHQLEHELRIALARDELWVAYQPVVDLVTDRIVGAEALVRWTHPTLGVVTPDQFVPLAEATGLIVPLGEFVLRRVCEDLVERPGWDRPGFEVAINVSGVQLAQADVAGQVEALLVRHGLSAGRLRIELTESVLIDAGTHVREQLAGLARLGVAIDIDDFGTGYSSLTYLREHPVSGIKVDRSFTAGLGLRAGDETIVAALVDLASKLDLGVVVEGVEQITHVEHLRKLRCRQAQGFLFGRPMPATDLEPGACLPDGIRSAQVELVL